MSDPQWTRGEDDKGGTWERIWPNNDGSTTTEVVRDDGQTYEEWEDRNGNLYVKDEDGHWEQT